MVIQWGQGLGPGPKYVRKEGNEMKTIKVKKTPKGILGWLWRRKAVKIDLEEPPNPEAVLHVRIGQDEPNPALADLADIGRYVRVEYCPDYEGNDSIYGGAPWVITVAIRPVDSCGTWYGNAGIDIINEVGLPGCLNGIQLFADNGGRALIRSLQPPKPQDIAAVVAHIENHTTAILDEYRRLQGFERYKNQQEKGAKK